MSRDKFAIYKAGLALLFFAQHGVADTTFDLSTPKTAHETCAFSPIDNITAENLNRRLDSCFTENGKVSFASRVIVFAGLQLGASEISNKSNLKKKIDRILAAHAYPTPAPDKEQLRDWVLRADLGKFSAEIMATGVRGENYELVSDETNIEGSTAKLIRIEKSSSGARVTREYTYVSRNGNWMLDAWTDRKPNTSLQPTAKDSGD
jgi:hypothetical protein